MILGMLIGLLWFALFFAGHVGVIRWVRLDVRARIIQHLFLVGLMGIVISLWPVAVFAQGSPLARGGYIMGLIWGVLSYIGLFVLYMPFYYTVIASLSVRTMVMLHRRSDGRIPMADLRGEFVSRRLVGQRLITMTTNGFLMSRGDAYALSTKGWLTAMVFSGIKEFWRLGTGG